MARLMIRKWLSTVLLCVLASAACCSEGVRSADPPFAWLAGEIGKAASSLRLALTVPGVKQAATEMRPCDAGRLYLDMTHSFGIRDTDTFRRRAYEVLDKAVSAERRLDETFRTPGKDERYTAAYYFLKYRLRFAQALCKAEISRRMAPVDSSYCMQAMESSIDCLKASADARDEFERLKSQCGYGDLIDPSAGTIRALREELLRVWESSKRQGNAAPILEMDIGQTVNKTMVSGVKDKRARRATGDILAWLRESSAGNHTDPAPVE